jgi:hypothetical protein
LAQPLDGSGTGLDARKNPLHVLVRRGLEPCIRCPRGVMLAKHIGEAVLHKSIGERTQPALRHCLGRADGLWAPKVEHAVQGMNCNRDLSGATVFRPRA